MIAPHTPPHTPYASCPHRTPAQRSRKSALTWHSTALRTHPHSVPQHSAQLGDVGVSTHPNGRSESLPWQTAASLVGVAPMSPQRTCPRQENDR